MRSLTFWGTVSATGQKILVKSERLKSVDYLQIWKKVGPEKYGEIFIFRQDNCTIYKANCVAPYSRENRFEVLEWPAYSPDLNIIETLWAIVQNRLAK